VDNGLSTVNRRDFYITFAAMCFLLFSIMFAYDMVELDAPNYDTHLQAGLLDAGVFIPGIFMAFGAGIVTDRFGIKVSCITASFLALLGTVLACLFSGQSGYEVMFLGRCMFGLGMEPSIVVAITALQLRADPKKLGFVLALFAASGRMGSLLVDAAPHWTDWNWVLSLSESVKNRMPNGGGILETFVTRLFRSGSHWPIAICLLFFSFLGLVCFCALTSKVERRVEKSVRSFNKVLKPAFWLLSIVCATCYASVFAARAFGLAFLIDLGNTPKQASSGLLLTSAIPLICSAPFGWLADRIRSLLFVLGGCVFLAGFALLCAERPIAFAIIGLGYATLPLVIWPSVRDCVAKDSQGFANGLMTAIQNAAIVGVLVLTGYIDDRFHPGLNSLQGYQVGNRLLLGCAVLCCLSIIAYLIIRSLDSRRARLQISPFV
jgi:MFS family permease